MRKLFKLREENRSYLLEQIQESESMTRCPYFRGIGICNNGCWEEPICHTNGPFTIPSPKQKRYNRIWHKWNNKYLKRLGE